MSSKSKIDTIDLLEEALQDPEIRAVVELGIATRNIIQAIGPVKAILMLTEQTRRAISVLIEKEEDRKAVIEAIILDLQEGVEGEEEIQVKKKKDTELN